jgi:hypothetical protein
VIVTIATNRWGGVGQRKVKLRNSYVYILTPIHRNGVFGDFYLFYIKGTPVLLDEHKLSVVYHCYILLQTEILVTLIEGI